MCYKKQYFKLSHMKSFSHLEFAPYNKLYSTQLHTIFPAQPTEYAQQFVCVTPISTQVRANAALENENNVFK